MPGVKRRDREQMSRVLGCVNADAFLVMTLDVCVRAN